MTATDATAEQAPIALAVVGHTNTGKTSLIRTLLRSSRFGAVRDAAGTTRHVEAATLTAAGQAVLQLFDTPGLEDSIALLEVLQALRPSGAAAGRERLALLLQHAADYPDFEKSG